MRKWKMVILLLHGIWPRISLILLSTCSAFCGYFLETSHSHYQAPVPSTKRKSDERAHRFSRAFWAGNWPIRSFITHGKWWGKRLLQNHGSDNRKSLSNPGLLYATHCLCFIFSLIWDPGTELKSGLPGWFVRAELAVLFETGWKGLEKEDCLLMVL